MLTQDLHPVDIAHAERTRNTQGDSVKLDNLREQEALSDIQNEYGYIPLEVQEVVSEETGISVAEIYGVVTFYSFCASNHGKRFKNVYNFHLLCGFVKHFFVH